MSSYLDSTWYQVFSAVFFSKYQKMNHKIRNKYMFKMRKKVNLFFEKKNSFKQSNSLVFLFIIIFLLSNLFGQKLKHRSSMIERFSIRVVA